MAKQTQKKEVVVTPFSANEKLANFMNLFHGREDVFPKRWENKKTGKSGYSPACRNEWIKGVCRKPQIKCSECTNQAFTPVTEKSVRNHLSQPNCVMGIYPMLKDETCWFSAVDFDKEHWRRDVSAFLETCLLRNVPASLERSRSGNGAHVWIFFSEPIAASLVRKMGATLLTETMERCSKIGFESYDRFFPNQDTTPSGGFGNLIALPLQQGSREFGNSIFLNENFEPYVDQWAYLSSVQKMTPTEVTVITEEAASKGCILGVRMPLEEEEERPWEMKPSRRKPELPLDQKLPETIEIVLGNQLFIAKKDIPPALKNKLIRLAAFQNFQIFCCLTRLL